jgi:putative transposase
VASDLKAIYSASTEAEAEFNLELFAEKWDALYPTKSLVVASPLDQIEPAV